MAETRRGFFGSLAGLLMLPFLPRSARVVKARGSLTITLPPPIEGQTFKFIAGDRDMVIATGQQIAWQYDGVAAAAVELSELKACNLTCISGVWHVNG